jgi:rhodanese-related sulfurtransferase
MVQHLIGAIAGKDKKAPETDVPQVVRDREAGTIQIVDVREPDEWAAGHIPAAVLIPLGHLAFRARELDPNRPVVTVCRSGNRSLTAADLLLKAGFQDVKSMAGGMIVWAGSGHPITR